MALPETAGAVLPGENGRIVFVSGRGDPDNNDSNARLYLRPVPFSTGGGTTSPTLTPGNLGQHRHPTWSPDRTKIAYSLGGEIRILDVTSPGSTPQNITNSAATDDRPAWSPDGERIAFESGAAGAQTDILLHTVGGGTTPVTNTNGATQFESKPAWAPDSQTLYYHKATSASGAAADIVRRQVVPAVGAEQNVLTEGGVSEFQPSISPDGNQMCYTRGAGFDGTADVYVTSATTNAPAGNDLSDNVGNMAIHGDYNCTWSPDGTLIAYVRGTFTSGDLGIERADDSQFFLPLEETPLHFDGNPDWAPDARPRCEDQTVTTLANTPVQIPVPCEDTGPAYERSLVRALASGSSNGTLSPDVAQDLPGNVTYTPNQGFSGTDTFNITSFDEFGFGDRQGTVTVNVQAPPGGGGIDNNFSLGKVKKNKKRGTAKLTVNVPGPGDLELAKTKKVKPVAKRAPAAGKVKLKIKPKGKAKKKLATKGKAKVKAKVTYTPDGGDPNTKTKKVKLKKKK